MNFFKTFICLIFLNWSCSVKQAQKGTSPAIEISAIDVFNLPNLSKDGSYPKENYSIQAFLADSIVSDFEIVGRSKTRNLFRYHFSPLDKLPAYYSDAYHLPGGCQFVDTFLIEAKKIYFSKTCYALKENIIFEKFSEDTVKIQGSFVLIKRFLIKKQ